MSQWALGISAAASWAWGVSLGVSFDILRTKGLATWATWAAANTSALLVFGAFVTAFPRYLRLRRVAPIKAAMVIIQLFCIWINVRIMADFIGQWWAAFAALLTFGLTYRWRLSYSVASDRWQYAVMLGALAAVTWIGRHGAAVPPAVPLDVRWLTPAVAGLLAGPLLDGQQFQRAELMTMRGWLVAGGSFAVYMALVYGAYAAHGAATTVLLAVVIVAVSTSTLDSCVASLQDLVGDRVTIALSLMAFATWRVFEHQTAIQIWSWYAMGRVFVVVPMVVFVIWEARSSWKNGRKNAT
jgi:hypothetical protein